MKISYTKLDREYFRHKSEYDKAAIEALESGMYILGKKVEKFEQEFSDFLGAKHCVALNSGLDALILAFRALGIGENDEVIVPANTYIASVLGITENSATPVFVEPDEYYNLDVDKIEEKITNKTKAILVVHLFGQAANMTAIKELALRHGLYLVEDCAQSHAAKCDNQVTGTIGDIGCFSFYPTKNLGAFGDSGAIITNNEDIYNKVKMLRNYGSRVKYQHEITGINSRMDEIQAALLSVKLSHYEILKKDRAQIANQYLSKINNKSIKLPKIREACDHVWHLFVIQTDNRDKLQKYLEDNGIQTQIHYPIPPHLTSAYANLGFNKGDFPITEWYSSTILSLPLFDGMYEEEFDYVIDIINKYSGEEV
jgi:dTDP-4-amino-4,6-dideoxygalactose transaminase